MKHSDPPIIVEEILDSSLTKVWEAITEAAQMKQWFFEQIESFKAEVGFETDFVVAVEDRTFTHLWKIVAVKAEHSIKYQWSYEEYPGDCFVTFELEEENNKVKIKLIAEVIEDFPDDVPEFKRESCIGGWTYFIKDRLKSYVEGQA